jgi:hypothetical protein
MVELLTAQQCTAQRFAVAQVAVYLLNFESFQISYIAARADQRADLDAGGHQCAGHGTAHESCRTGDESLHGNDKR